MMTNSRGNDLAVIIVSYNSSDEIRACLDSVRNAQRDLSMEVWVVDNNSSDNTVELVRSSYSEVRLIENKSNVGFPKANNQAIKQVQSAYVLLLNPDTVVEADAFISLIEFMVSNPDCGVCGPQLYDGNGVKAPDLRAPSFWYYLLALTPIPRKRRHEVQEQEAISGAGLLFRRSLVSDVGLLDETLFWSEDIDFCLRARREGYRICKVSNAGVRHLCGGSTRSNFEGKMYTRHVTLICLINKHYRGLRRWSLLSVALIEIALRTAKWYLTRYMRPSDEADSKLRGLRRAIRELPQLIFETDRKHVRKGHVVLSHARFVRSRNDS
jgi:GT2 family glycosyltransferase